MIAADIVLLLKKLGCDKVKVRSNGWVVSSCPLAPYTHGGGIDSSPSFGVHAQDGRSGFRCLSCGRAGDLGLLPIVLQAFGDRRAQAVLAFIQRKNHASLAQIQERLERASYKTEVRVVSPAQTASRPRPVSSLLGEAKYVILPDEDLRHFMKLPDDVLASPVMSKRRITPQTYERWQIRWQPWAHRIAIPTRDFEKRLVGIAGRLGDDDNCTRCHVPFEVIYLPPKPGAPNQKPKKRVRCPECDYDRPPKYLHTTGFHRDYFIFGEDRIRPAMKLFLVEGQFDTVSMHQSGYNTGGIMGSWLSEQQKEKVLAWAPEVVMVAESDKAGLTLAASVRDQLSARVPFSIVNLPESRDIDELSDDEKIALLGPPNLL